MFASLSLCLEVPWSSVFPTGGRAGSSPRCQVREALPAPFGRFRLRPPALPAAFGTAAPEPCRRARERPSPSLRCRFCGSLSLSHRENRRVPGAACPLLLSAQPTPAGTATPRGTGRGTSRARRSLPLVVLAQPPPGTEPPSPLSPLSASSCHRCHRTPGRGPSPPSRAPRAVPCLLLVTAAAGFAFASPRSALALVGLCRFRLYTRSGHSVTAAVSSSSSPRGGRPCGRRRLRSLPQLVLLSPLTAVSPRLSIPCKTLNTSQVSPCI